MLQKLTIEVPRSTLWSTSSKMNKEYNKRRSLREEIQKGCNKGYMRNAPQADTEQLEKTKAAESTAELAEAAHKEAVKQFYKQEVVVCRVIPSLFGMSCW